MSTAHGTGGQQATKDLDERAGELASGYGTLALAGDHGALAGRTRIAHVHARLPGAAMGFYSTASDMARYFSCHLVGFGTGVLGDDSKRLMQRKAEDSVDPNGFAGYGGKNSGSSSARRHALQARRGLPCPGGAAGMEPGAVSRSGNNAGAIRRSFRVDGAARGHQHLGYDPC